MKVDGRTVVLSLLLCCATSLPLARFVIPQAAGKGSDSHPERHRCPMHPTMVQDGEGNCAICGMKLVAVISSSQSGPKAIAVAPDKQAVVGIAVGVVPRTASRRTLRLLGRVIPDETRLYRINAGVEGSFRDVSTAATTGSPVRKDQILGSYYAPAAINTIQIFLLNTAGYQRAAQKKSEGSLDGENLALIDANLQQRLIQFENLGVSARQREQIRRSRRIPDTLELVAPADGFILARNASPGFKFERGMELFRIADLRRVWVLADVFSEDAAHVRAGMAARIVVPEQRATLPGTVTGVLPQFDAASRTLKVRVEADNPGFVLRPDMFVEVQLPVELPVALTVPIDAVVDTGLSHTVFVETAPGTFEPRQVETGFRNGDRIEIAGGLAEGERIATSGVFFLDSETRMRAPASGVVARATVAPVPTGHERMSSVGAGPTNDAREAAHTGAVESR